MVHNLLNFLNSVLINNFFFNNFDLFDSRYFNFHLDNLFNDSWNFNNFFYCLNKRDWSVNRNFNDFRDFLNMVDNFSGILNFDLFD